MIWYNGIPTIKAKARMVDEQKLGGVMIWSPDNDVKGESSLRSAIHEVLTAAPTSTAQEKKP
jgi:chitinase